jgi:acetylornithine deacetylase/succinyl-diaminopimelate desuccinylase-like protein
MNMIDRLAELVNIKSYENSEQIADYIEKLGLQFNAEVIRVGNSVAMFVPGKNRQLASKKVLIFDGHIDTVPVDEEWSLGLDPFKLTPHPENPDRLYGLGASDMKAGVAIMLDDVEKCAIDPPEDYDSAWLFTDGEEVTNKGAKELFADPRVGDRLKAYQTRGGVIFEPTVEDGADKPFIGIKEPNSLILEVTARGEGGHARNEHPNMATAIEKLGWFSSVGVAKIRKYLRKRHTDPLLGPPTITATRIHADSGAHNKHPEVATATFDFRIPDSLVKGLHKVLGKFANKWGLEITSPWPTANTTCPPDAYILEVMKTTFPDRTFKGFWGTSDLFVFLENGIPMVTMGWGFLDEMHARDEHVSKQKILEGPADIAAIRKNF